MDQAVDRVSDAAALRPHPTQVSCERLPDGRVVLSRRRFGPVRALLGKPFGVAAHKRVTLDPLAAAAWDAMDGKRTVGEIRDLLAASHPEEPDINVRLGRLVSLLASHGFVAL